MTLARLCQVAWLSLLLHAAASAALGASSAADESVPWQAIDALATRFVAHDSLPH